jgi:hypothetical protein
MIYQFLPEQIFVPIEMSAEQQQTSTAAPPTGTTGSAAANAAAGAAGNSEAEGLLKQADLLKEQQMESQKALEKQTQEKSAMEKELAYYRARAAAEKAKYAAEQEPKFKEYIQELQVTAGKNLPEQKIKQYHTLFTDPEFKDDADAHFARHREMVELKASKKQYEEDLAKERAEKAKLNDTLSKASHQMGGMRKSYADSLATAAEQQQREPLRKEVNVNASLNANEIMCSAAAAVELPFLQRYGFSNEVNVNASSGGGMHGSAMKPIRTSIAAAREHPLLLDEDGDPQFPYSARYLNPTRFAWMVNEAPFERMDLTEMVAVSASKTFLEEKRVE